MKTLLGILMALTLLSGRVAASDAQTLKGVTAFQVVIEDLKPEAAKYGLPESLLKTDVELKLRLAGLKIDPSSVDYLYVRVNILDPNDSSLWVFNIDVQFVQPVYLSRDLSIQPLATTWNSEAVGSVGRELAAQRIRQAVKDHIDEFINAYLSVNPKQ